MGTSSAVRRVSQGLVLLCACSTVTLVLPAPLGAQPVEDASLELERERLKLDQDRLQLARDRFEHDKGKTASSSNWYDWPPLGWLAGFIGVGLTWFLTRMTEREKHRQEMISIFDQDLRKGRIAAYRKLWGKLKPLSLYGGGTFQRTDAAALRISLRDWYFEDGMFLSGRQHGTREKYFALQNALVLVSAYGEINDILAAESDNINHAEAEKDQAHFTRFSKDDTELPKLATSSNFMQYRFLRALGSLLRTETVNDVHTRAAALNVYSVPVREL